MQPSGCFHLLKTQILGMFKLRKYQASAILESLDYLYSKQKLNMISVLPTAAGKSIVIANIAKNLDHPVLCIQPSKELLVQNYNKLISYGYEAGIYSASLNKREVSKITYATIGSIYKKPELFSEFKYIIVDECHIMSPNKSEDSSSMYVNLFKELNAKVLGLTATPFRLKSFSYPDQFSQLNMITRMRPKVFSDIIHVTQIKEMVDGGYWSPIEYRTGSFDKSKLVLNSNGAEYTEQSIESSLHEQNVVSEAIKMVNELIKEEKKQILVFAPTIDISDHIAKKLKTHSLTSKTESDKRDKILRDFHSNRLKSLVNVNILSVGYDNQKIDAIVDLIPTMSLARYYQRIGRGVRVDLHEVKTKTDCVYVDLVGNSEMFGKVEDLEIRKVNGLWNVCSGDKIITHQPFIKRLSVPELDNEKLDFGKYIDQPLKSVPEWYLKWIYDNQSRTQSREYIFQYVEKAFK